jgi:hypothetical protein
MQGMVNECEREPNSSQEPDDRRFWRWIDLTGMQSRNVILCRVVK